MQTVDANRIIQINNHLGSSNILACQRRDDFSLTVARSSVEGTMGQRLLEALRIQANSTLHHLCNWKKQHQEISQECFVKNYPMGKIVIVAIMSRERFSFGLSEALLDLRNSLLMRFNLFDFDTLQLPQYSLSKFFHTQVEKAAKETMG